MKYRTWKRMVKQREKLNIMNGRMKMKSEKWKVNKITIPWSSESEEIWIVGRGTELRNEIEEHNESAIFRERERERERERVNVKIWMEGRKVENRGMG